MKGEIRRSLEGSHWCSRRAAQEGGVGDTLCGCCQEGTVRQD